MPSHFHPAMPSPGLSRPLHGVTVLLVDDSRFASDALRLMTLHLGGRLRRADSLRAAYAHLATYDPDVVIVDLGLPDGRGEDMIRDLAAEPHPRATLLGTSGDPAGRDLTLAAGADGFLPKPLPGLAAFLAMVLPGDTPQNPTPATTPTPDPLALHDDLRLAQNLLAAVQTSGDRDHLAGFLTGLGRTSGDTALMLAADGLRQGRSLPHLPALLQGRIVSTCRI